MIREEMEDKREGQDGKGWDREQDGEEWDIGEERKERDREEQKGR